MISVIMIKYNVLKVREQIVCMKLSVYCVKLEDEDEDRQARLEGKGSKGYIGYTLVVSFIVYLENLCN